MDVFAGRYIALEFVTLTPFKTKQHLRKHITDHGGIVSFIVTRKVLSQQLFFIMVTVMIVVFCGTKLEEVGSYTHWGSIRYLCVKSN